MTLFYDVSFYDVSVFRDLLLKFEMRQFGDARTERLTYVALVDADKSVPCARVSAFVGGLLVFFEAFGVGLGQPLWTVLVSKSILTWTRTPIWTKIGV